MLRLRVRMVVGLAKLVAMPPQLELAPTEMPARQNAAIPKFAATPAILPLKHQPEY